MKKIKYMLLGCFLCFNLGCTLTKTRIFKKNLPLKNYVKIIRTIEILECKKTDKSPCVAGVYTSSGSGLALGPLGTRPEDSVVLTAGHLCTLNIQPRARKLILKLKFSIFVIDHANVTYPSTVVLTTTSPNRPKDLCVLKVPDLKSDPIRYSTSEPEPGDDVYNLASPLGIYHPPTMPILHGIYSGKTSSTIALTTVPAIGGSSGSPIFNNRGELVGVLFAAVPNFNNISLSSTRESTISFLLRALRILKPKPQP